jgi:YidC/Oxa1 family membrane protein insertase
MNKMALYVFPLGVVVGGPFLPLAIILYWYANNIWTFGQQHYVFGKIEEEEQAKKLEAQARRAANAPAPGAKPKRERKTPPDRAAAPPEELPESTGTGVRASESSGSDTNGATGVKPGARAGAGNRVPQPGARPKRKKR